MIALGVLKDSIRLSLGKWTVALLTFDILINCCSFALALFMFADQSLWNPDFMQQMAQTGLAPAGSDAFESVRSIWGWTTERILYLIGAAVVVQVITQAVKAVKIKRLA